MCWLVLGCQDGGELLLEGGVGILEGDDPLVQWTIVVAMMAWIAASSSGEAMVKKKKARNLRASHAPGWPQGLISREMKVY